MTFSVNPFYATRRHPSVPPPVSKAKRAYALLPLAPINASSVPHLTSLFHFSEAGSYGSRSYPSNCGGNLIRDLLLYFQSQNVFDPMTGSGTRADVCRELGIPCESKDIRYGFDATDRDSFTPASGKQRFDFIWAHPPYWRQKLYIENPGDLSRTGTLVEFLGGYERFIRNCAQVLAENGKFAILMGDYSDRYAGFVSLTQATKELAFAAGVRHQARTSSHSGTAHPAAARPTAVGSFPDCMTPAWCSSGRTSVPIDQECVISAHP